MSIFDDILNAGARVVDLYGTVKAYDIEQESTGVEQVLAQSELARQNALAEQARAEAAAALSRNETLKRVALYLSIAVSVISLAGYIFKKKRGK